MVIMLGPIIRFILFCLIIYFVYRWWKKRSVHNKNTSPNSSTHQAPSNEPEMMVQDPVCGTYVSRNDGIVFRSYYFCSKECLQSFTERQ